MKLKFVSYFNFKTKKVTISSRKSELLMKRAANDTFTKLMFPFKKGKNIKFLFVYFVFSK